MLNIKKNISINASAEKVWNFLLSLRYSMLMNRSYTKVDFPLNLEDSFKIHQNLAIVKYIFDTTIDSKKTFKELTLTKTLSGKPEFFHSISYIILSSNNNLKLDYHLSGDFGSMILEMSLKPILHGIIIDELRNIKLAIESSDKRVEDYHSLEKLKPI